MNAIGDDHTYIQRAKINIYNELYSTEIIFIRLKILTIFIIITNHKFHHSHNSHYVFTLMFLIRNISRSALLLQGFFPLNFAQSNSSIIKPSRDLNLLRVT